MKSETDPIAEAEVYIAYGREAKARAVLEEAVRRDPSREDIRRKLAQLGAPASRPAPVGVREAFAKIILPMTAPSLVWLPGFLLMGGISVAAGSSGWPGSFSSSWVCYGPIASPRG